MTENQFLVHTKLCLWIVSFSIIPGTLCRAWNSIRGHNGDSCQHVLLLETQSRGGQWILYSKKHCVCGQNCPITPNYRWLSMMRLKPRSSERQGSTLFFQVYEPSLVLGNINNHQLWTDIQQPPALFLEVPARLCWWQVHTPTPWGQRWIIGNVWQ